jgi:hypothetical protein
LLSSGIRSVIWPQTPNSSNASFKATTRWACSKKRTFFAHPRPDSCHEHCTASRNVYPSFPLCPRSELAMSYYYVPRPAREHICLLAMRCYTPQPPDIYYQPPAQEYSYQPPPQRYVYQPPAQVYEYQPPPQRYVYQPAAQRCVPEPGDARAFWELGIPGRSYGWPILF